MRTDVTETVRSFYEILPFNYHGTLEKACQAVRENPIHAYPDLHALLLISGRIRSIIEAGCGAGWFANSAALHYHIPVHAIDLTEKAVRRARDVARELNTESFITFETGNLFDFQPEAPADLVVSIGVLPALADPEAAFRHISRFVSSGGFIFLGLYHHYGRKVFRDLFDRILREEGEAAALARYRSMHPQLEDDTLTESWFRDQVLHPHEVWHTLEEVVTWFGAYGFRLHSTSINQFKKIKKISELIQLERTYETRSHQANIIENRYFPGFFTVMGQKS